MCCWLKDAGWRGRGERHQETLSAWRWLPGMSSVFVSANLLVQRTSADAAVVGGHSLPVLVCVGGKQKDHI